MMNDAVASHAFRAPPTNDGAKFRFRRRPKPSRQVVKRNVNVFGSTFQMRACIVAKNGQASDQIV